MVGKAAVERRSSAVRTRGGRSGTLGEWVAEEEREARGTLVWAGGGQRAAIDGELVWGRWQWRIAVPGIDDQRLGLQPGATQRGGDGGPSGQLRRWRRWVGLHSPVNRDGGDNGAQQGARAKRGRGEVRKEFSAWPRAAFIGSENRLRWQERWWELGVMENTVAAAI
jgi:hypothetical protein